MKTNPTGLDREAATLFRPAPGMRALAGGQWVRVVMADPRPKTGGWVFGFACEDYADVGMGEGVDAIDTDDPATLGCMLGQVREHTRTFVAYPGDDGAFYADARGDDVLLMQRILPRHETEGAALVAAMRSLKPH